MPSQPIKFAARTLSIGEYWDSDKITARRKHRLWLETQSNNGKTLPGLKFLLKAKIEWIFQSHDDKCHLLSLHFDNF